MEQQLFDYDEFYDDDDCDIYLGVELKISIGEHNIGTVFDEAIIGENYLQLANYRKSGGYSRRYKYELSYQVGKQIKK